VIERRPDALAAPAAAVCVAGAAYHVAYAVAVCAPNVPTAAAVCVAGCAYHVAYAVAVFAPAV
jgi:hypothetical protein